MKTHRIIIASILTLTPLAVLAAAPYVQRLAVPPPGQYGIADLWKVTLYNPDSQNYEVWLEGAIAEARKGQVFWAKTNRFPLPPKTKVIRYADIQSIGIDSQSYAPGYKEFAARTGGLPEGDYTFTVKLMPDFGSKPIHFIVKPMGPPRLIMPKDGDTTKVKYPVFAWTPPAPKPPGPVTYTLKVFEVLDGQTREEAAAANLPWFEKRSISATSLTYPVSARVLDVDDTEGYGPEKIRTQAYAWQVSAVLSDSQTAASAVWQFDATPDGALPEIVIPLKVNVLKGMVCTPEEEEHGTGGDKLGRNAVEKRLVAMVEATNKQILAHAGIKLDFSKDNINWEVADPDKTNDSKMDRNYSDDEANAVNDKANEELKRKFGDGKKVRGFKLYIVSELLNKGAGESGVGYWFPPDSPGFAALEIGALWEGIDPFELLAHEILHGLGCLKDSGAAGNAMNPGKDRGTDLTPEQTEQLRTAAAKRN